MLKPQVIVAGETAAGVWCVPCNAPVEVRGPLPPGSRGPDPAAEITVCASCGNRFIPFALVVTLTRPVLQSGFVTWGQDDPGVSGIALRCGTATA
jgi:hypothetical protein